MAVLLIRSAVLIVMLLAAAAAPLAQNDDQPDAAALLDQADQQLQAGNWSAARLILQELLARDSLQRDLYLYKRAKAAYHSGDYTTARAEFDLLLIEYPDSPYAPFAVYFWANSAMATGRPAQALPEYIRAYAGATDRRLQDLIADAISTVDRRLMREYVTAANLSRLTEQQRCWMVRQVGERLLSQHRVDDAVYVLSLCESPVPRAITHLTDTLGANLRVGVVVPLSGEYQQYGEAILNGANIAIRQAGSPFNHTITLSPFDTQGDAITAGRIVSELAKLNYDAIIGPLTTAEASVAAAAVSGYDMPLIIPAASGSGLTLFGENSFQLSPNIELQGVLLAEYAFRNLSADSAAIITPTSAEYLQIAQAFATHFEELGGSVVAVEYYRSSDRDFGQYIQSIKSLLLSGVDADAVFLNQFGDTIDAKSIPASLDCLFLPGSPEQLRLLVPQVRFYNLSGAFLGSDGWGSDQMYQLGDDVCGGALFASPFLQRGAQESEFTRLYSQTYGEEYPSRLACLGYDAVSVLLRALTKQPVTRLQWLAELARTSSHDGAAGKITFGQFRENIELPLYQIQAGRPILVGLSRGEPAVPPESR